MAVLLAIGSFVAVQPVGQWLESSADSFTDYSLVRVLWCLVLELPWHVGAWLAVPSAAQLGADRIGRSEYLRRGGAAGRVRARLRSKTNRSMRGDLDRNKIIQPTLSAALTNVGSPWKIADESARTWRDPAGIAHRDAAGTGGNAARSQATNLDRLHRAPRIWRSCSSGRKRAR